MVRTIVAIASALIFVVSIRGMRERHHQSRDDDHDHHFGERERLAGVVIRVRRRVMRIWSVLVSLLVEDDKIGCQAVRACDRYCHASGMTRHILL